MRDLVAGTLGAGEIETNTEPDPRDNRAALLNQLRRIASSMRADLGDATSVAEMAKLVGSEPQAFDPGERQEYSNGGYVVLGRVVEVVSGQAYADYVSEHIYRFAGMTSSGFLEKSEGDPEVIA